MQISRVVTRHKKWRPSHPLSPETRKAIYEFWLQQGNAIMSTDRRFGGDELCISKLNIPGIMPSISISDTKFTEKEVVLRKTKTKKKNLTAQRMVYIVQ